jgi:hypothetical protein
MPLSRSYTMQNSRLESRHCIGKSITLHWSTTSADALGKTLPYSAFGQ